MVLRPIKLSAECKWTALPTCKVKKYLFPAKSEKRPFRSFSPGTSDYFNHRGLSHSIFFVGSWNHNCIGTSLSSLPQLPPFHTEHLPYKTYTIIESPSFGICGYLMFIISSCRSRTWFIEWMHIKVSPRGHSLNWLSWLRGWRQTFWLLNQKNKQFYKRQSSSTCTIPMLEFATPHLPLQVKSLREIQEHPTTVPFVSNLLPWPDPLAVLCSWLVSGALPLGPWLWDWS